MNSRMIVLALSLLAVICSPLAPLPDHNKFFMLSPISEEGVAKTGTPIAQQLSIGVGPIDFPDYLRRQEVVTRTAANRIDVSQANRWAGPVDKNFTRVLSENLATLLSTQRVENYPWSRSTLVDYQVVVYVERFDTGSDGKARLVARWSIRDGHDGKVLCATETTSSVPVGSGEEGPSAGLSSNLATMSREIASQLTLLSGHPGGVLPSRLVTARPDCEQSTAASLNKSD
jgi:uncharacterized protein